VDQRQADGDRVALRAIQVREDLVEHSRTTLMAATFASWGSAAHPGDHRPDGSVVSSALPGARILGTLIRSSFAEMRRLSGADGQAGPRGQKASLRVVI
jgi:hypothetical protein